MTAQISAYGRLVADPQTRTTTNGNNMAMARLAVSLPCNAAEAGESTFWLGVIAFGKQADALATLRPRHQREAVDVLKWLLQSERHEGRDEMDTILLNLVGGDTDNG